MSENYGWGIPESQIPVRKQNPFIDYRTCQHCGKEIGHRPYTRDWEHVNPNPKECERPFPNIGTCMYDECENTLEDELKVKYNNKGVVE